MPAEASEVPFGDDENAPAGTGKRPHPTIAGRWSDGTVRPGASGPSNPAFRHGKFMAPPAELPASAESTDATAATGATTNAASATAQMRTELESDPVAVALRTTGQRIIEHDAILRVVVNEGVANGFTTPRGRPKTLISTYLAIANAQQVLFRRLIELHDRAGAKTILDLPLADFLKQGDGHADADTAVPQESAHADARDRE